MQAAIQHVYGAPQVLTVGETTRPTVGDNDILVHVHASPVTQGDRRLRAADFPGISALPGRLMFGLLAPRNPVPGTMYAGKVAKVGANVTRLAVGDDVFGGVMTGAMAQYVSVPEDSDITRMPEGVTYEQAAAVPYGAVTALLFLRDHGEVKEGQSVLIVGAAGGVGRFAVQVAKHLGAEVTAVCSSRSAALMRELGADHVIDYAAEDFTNNGQRYDVIFDTPDASSFSQCRGSLTDKGRYLSLHISLGVMFQMALTSMTDGPRAIFGAAFGTHEELALVSELVQQGAITPLIDRVFPLSDIAQAHAHLDTRRADGSVVVTMPSPKPAIAAQA